MSNPKFKKGDFVVGNDIADVHYGVTVKGTVWKVFRVFPEDGYMHVGPYDGKDVPGLTILSKEEIGVIAFPVTMDAFDLLNIGNIGNDSYLVLLKENV